uniref:Gem-associated protein 7 n=1 Tax=Chloropicon laureae TaxID=464258 RepID=A0A7S2Z3V0_9CHLO|mmetsp:Transcript_3868/g.9756  ORF Transcript_3868/g.9756 Transcript_3868/m.9756 type:complete len:109 (+) Transcript_3868:303-629(+)
MGAEAEAEAEEEAECLTDEVDTKGVAAQRTRFLDLLQDTCRKKAAVEVRFHGPGVEGVVASGNLVAVESTLDEILVENLATPTGDIPLARVNMDDVLYIKLLKKRERM